MKQKHTIKLYDIEVTGEVTYEWIDDSFSHEFGVEKRGHWEAFEVMILKAYDKNGSEIFVFSLSDEFIKQATEMLKNEN